MQTEIFEKNRILSLDLFRGLTIAGMILVNNQGDWGHVYPALRHASWHGWLGADIVFPFFLFVMGASLHNSFTGQLESGAKHASIFLKIIRRTALLMALGLFLNLFPFFDFVHVRIPGVLQRIGLCYFFASVFYLYIGQKGRIMVTALILGLYGALLLWVTPDGFGHGSLEPCCNLPGFIDRLIFNGHTYEHAPVPGFDPEGLLSTLPAIASTMMGVFAASWIGGAPSGRKSAWLAAGGMVLMAAGVATDVIIPINKNLWTPSYALFMGGMAALVFSSCYFLYDVMGRRRLSLPFLVLGRNAITVYLLSSMSGKAMISVKAGPGSVPVKTILYSTLFEPWLGQEMASFLYAAVFLCAWVMIMYIPYRKQVFISL
jgi:predicted acyltransferase